MHATTNPKPQAKADKTDKTDRVEDKIKEQVLATLGKPRDFYRIDVHLYRGGSARVNVWRTVKDKPANKGGLMGSFDQSDIVEQRVITDSHYLSLSKSAVIETANPPIARKYGN